MLSKKERERLASASYRKLVVRWIEQLAAHFDHELGEEQIEVFLEALVRDSDYQINEAFTRCLNECIFMPKLAEVHQKMPERKYPSTANGAFVEVGPPILDLVRPIAREICVRFCGREYDDLDTIKDAKLIMVVFRKANVIRYLRMGINPEKWIQEDELKELRTWA
jgi:hypothetical protein